MAELPDKQIMIGNTPANVTNVVHTKHASFLDFKVGDEVDVTFSKDGKRYKEKAIITGVYANSISFEPVDENNEFPLNVMWL